jgi:hypothetical protein
MLIRWTGFEPIQGGGVMPIRIRCLDTWPPVTYLKNGIDYRVFFGRIGGVLYRQEIEGPHLKWISLIIAGPIRIKLNQNK